MSADSARSPTRSFVSKSVDTWNRVAASIPRTAALSMVGPALLVILGYILWINYGARHLDHSIYGLQASNITLSSPPPWIHEDITAEVYQGSNLAVISLLDREATSAIAMAYENHPWIDQVLRVQKMAASQVKVDVHFRRPFAWIHCERQLGGRYASETDPLPGTATTPAIIDQFYLVDETGVNLPQKGFQPADILKSFQIYCPGVSVPTGPVGSVYNDSRILKALKVCEALQDVRQSLQIERVNVHPERPDAANVRWVFELQFRDGRTQAWGHAPGEEDQGEANVATKVATLTHSHKNVPVSMKE